MKASRISDESIISRALCVVLLCQNHLDSRALNFILQKCTFLREDTKEGNDSVARNVKKGKSDTGTPPLTRFLGPGKNRVIYITDVKTLASAAS